MNCGSCNKPVAPGDIVHDEITCLRVQLDKTLLQNGELRKALQGFVEHPRLYPNVGDDRIAEAVALLGITEKRNDECTCNWTPHLLDCPVKINQGRR